MPPRATFFVEMGRGISGRLSLQINRSSFLIDEIEGIELKEVECDRHPGSFFWLFNVFMTSGDIASMTLTHHEARTVLNEIERNCHGLIDRCTFWTGARSDVAFASTTPDLPEEEVEMVRMDRSWSV